MNGHEVRLLDEHADRREVLRHIERRFVHHCWRNHSGRIDDDERVAIICRLCAAICVPTTP